MYPTCTRHAARHQLQADRADRPTWTNASTEHGRTTRTSLRIRRLTCVRRATCVPCRATIRTGRGKWSIARPSRGRTPAPASEHVRHTGLTWLESLRPHHL